MRWLDLYPQLMMSTLSEPITGLRIVPKFNVPNAPSIEEARALLMVIFWDCMHKGTVSFGKYLAGY